MIRIELPGEPRGKGRPRSRVAWTKADSPFVAVYTDKETQAYEKALATVGRAAMRGRAPLTGPLLVTIIADFPVPASWSRKRRDAALAGVIRPTGKPDYDNVAKIATDALGRPARRKKDIVPPVGIVFNDDAQIVDSRIVKRYSERPCLTITVEELSVWTEETDRSKQLSLV